MKLQNITFLVIHISRALYYSNKEDISYLKRFSHKVLSATAAFCFPILEMLLVDSPFSIKFYCNEDHKSKNLLPINVQF